MTVSMKSIFSVSFKGRSEEIRYISHFPWIFVSMDDVQHVRSVCSRRHFKNHLSQNG